MARCSPREIGGAVGITVVSTVLVARTSYTIQIVGPAATEAAALEGFQSVFTVIVVVAAVGALVAAVAFPRLARGMRTGAGEAAEPVRGPGVASEVAHDRAGARPALDSSSDAVEARSDGRA
jgi:predicted anti-sigma-YlaC factor YlaD